MFTLQPVPNFIPGEYYLCWFQSLLFCFIVETAVRNHLCFGAKPYYVILLNKTVVGEISAKWKCIKPFSEQTYLFPLILCTVINVFSCSEIFQYVLIRKALFSENYIFCS